MRRIFQIALLVLLTPFVHAQSDQVIDSVVAVVNSSPIFQSDWEVAVRYEALMSGRLPESYTAEEQRAVFQRLVDQVLIRQQMRGFELTAVTNNEIQTQLRQLKSQLPNASKDDVWQKLLVQAGLTEAEVMERFKNQLEIVRFLEYRMRPTVRVDQRTVVRYYREQYLPELKKQGADEVPLAQVSDKIREILTQQRMEEQTALWLQTLRDAADVRISDANTNPGTEMTRNK